MAEKKQWHETLHDQFGQYFAVDNVLYHEKTDHQDLIIFENAAFGRVMALDGVVQTTERDEFIYHEMMTHVPLLAHGHAKHVLIIGGGVVGSAIAREMARNKLSIGVLEKNLDVCYETSGRNSGVVHGGFAYDPGTLKAACCVEGNIGFDQLAGELDIPFSRCGKVLVGNTEEDMATLKRTIEQGRVNGARDLRLIDKEELHRLVPAVVGEFAMFSPNSGIVDPFKYTIALAENAVQNGVEYFFDSQEALNAFREQGKIVEERTYDTVMGPWTYFTVLDGQFDSGGRDILMIGTLESYGKMREFFGGERMVPVYIQVDDGIRLERAVMRERLQKNPNYSEVCRRFLADEEDFSEEKLVRLGIERRFVNQDMDQCLEEICAMIRG